MLQLPTPVKGGSIDELRTLLNLAENADWTLAKAWLVQALRPPGPYPVLVMHGEQGSAKSTTSRMLRALTDPSTAPLRTEPRNGRDLMIAATYSWLIGLDNLGSRERWHWLDGRWLCRVCLVLDLAPWTLACTDPSTNTSTA
jgi:hypothetical protein